MNTSKYTDAHENTQIVESFRKHGPGCKSRPESQQLLGNRSHVTFACLNSRIHADCLSYLGGDSSKSSKLNKRWSSSARYIRGYVSFFAHMVDIDYAMCQLLKSS